MNIEYNRGLLICGGIGGGAQMALAKAGIRHYGGVSGTVGKISTDVRETEEAASKSFNEEKNVFIPLL